MIVAGRKRDRLLANGSEERLKPFRHRQLQSWEAESRSHHLEADRCLRDATAVPQ